MGIGSIAKLSIFGLSLQANLGVWANLSHHHLHRFYYARSAHQFCKQRASCPFYISAPYNSYSSLSSSSSRMGFLRWYLGKLDSRPIITKAITASLIYMAADLTSQMITLPPSGFVDSIRILRMAGFGLLIVGPGQHMWFNFIAKILPKRDIITTLKKLIMGQVLYGPCVNGVFFSFNAALQGENGDEIVGRLKRDLLPTLFNGLLFWPICDFLIYKVIPVHLQPLINSSFSYVWTIYLTYVANLEAANNR